MTDVYLHGRQVIRPPEGGAENNKHGVCGGGGLDNARHFQFFHASAIVRTSCTDADEINSEHTRISFKH